MGWAERCLQSQVTAKGSTAAVGTWVQRSQSHLTVIVVVITIIIIIASNSMKLLSQAVVSLF